MMKHLPQKFFRIALFVPLMWLAVSCMPDKLDVTPDYEVAEQTVETTSTAVTTGSSTATSLENLETGGSKTSYAAANVELATGSWLLTDALIGTLSTDKKSGARSVRIQNTGSMRMNFNVRNGIGTVNIKHAVFGSDGSSSWELWMSTNSGSTWTKVGSTVTSSSTSLTTASFTLNRLRNVRLEIRKVSGGSNRINIDDISFTNYVFVSSSVHLTLGNPSYAVFATNYPSNYLMEKYQYTLSYHRDRGIPNWVAWHLQDTWLGSAPRQNDFRSDMTLPDSWYKVTTSDYTNSGFDRGHHCPSADRTASTTDNSATFLMTNIFPQSPDNNQGPWARLESYCRSLTTQGYELYVYSGGYGQGGTGSNGTFNTIAGGKVLVPARTWKVIIVLPKGSNDISRVSTATRVIAVDMPNSQGIRNDAWESYKVTARHVESRTGYDFLSHVSLNIQNVIENKVD
jgi:endonuclease G, mitochondrial